jgi:DNA (cytosine-5)-methyltransferase 1
MAGKGKGVDDERHLWPHFFRLIRSCRPKVIMGEQVAGPAGYSWFDGVRSDLEGESYAIEGVDIPACSANAPHIRQRIFWAAKDVADTEGRRWRVQQPKDKRQASGKINASSDDSASSVGTACSKGYWDNAIWLNGAEGKTRRVKSRVCLLADGVPARLGKLRAYGNAIVPQIAAEVIKAFMETL